MARDHQHDGDGDGHAEPEDEAGNGVRGAREDAGDGADDQPDNDDNADEHGTADADEHGVHATAPDARLTDLLRGDTSAAQPALAELRARHRRAVLRYARLCTADEPAARRLTAETFTSAVGETVRGLDPRGPWRHHLLVLTGRVAASWATDERADRLAPGLTAHFGETDPATGPRLLAAFQSLPSRVQGLVWYGLVEQEPEERTALFLGCTREDVTYESEPAFQALRHSVLTALLARSANPRCQDFRRLIEEAAHPEHPRHSADLQDHMAHCGHCAGAYRELAALRDTPRTALAEGLLAWRGTAYVLGGSAETRPRGGTADAGDAGWRPSRRLALVTAALGVAAVTLLYLLTSGGPEPKPTAAAHTPARPPVAAAPATPSASPSASPSRTAESPGAKRPSPPSKSPTPTATRPKPTPTKSAAKKPEPSPKPHPPNGTYAQVVNAGTGLCLDIRDGAMQLDTDVIAVPCTSSRTQRWRFDSDRSVLQSYADPDYCLDSRGSVHRGVGIWECRAVYGGNGQNLRFTVDDQGAIRPAIAPGYAVTPYGSGVVLSPDEWRKDQRWWAGAS